MLVYKLNVCRAGVPSRRRPDGQWQVPTHANNLRARHCHPSGRTLRTYAKMGDEEEADWDKEMSIFNKRISAPNQLATLRELEAKALVGKVCF